MKKYNNSKKNKLEKVSNKFDSTIRSMKKSKNIQKKLLGVFSSNYYQQINNHQKNINKIKIPIKFVKQPDKISVSTSFQNSKINNYNREINSKNYSKFFIKPTSTIPVVSMNIPASKQDFIIPTDNLNESTKNNSSNLNTSLVSTNELNKKNVYNNSYSQYAQQFTNPYQFSYQNNSPYAFAPNSFDQSYENQQMLSQYRAFLD